MKNKTDISKYVLIAVATILFIAMLVLCGMYLDLNINGKFSSIPSIPENDKWILTGTEYDSGLGLVGLTSPVFIGYKNSTDGMVAACYDTDSRTELIDKFEGCIPVLFSGKQHKPKFTKQEDKSEYIKNLLDNEKFAYINYYSEIPSSVIFSDFGGTDEISSENMFFVKYMFVLPDEKGNLYGVCLDENLDVIELMPKENMNYDENMLFAYNGMRGFAQFDFVSDIYPEAIFTKSFETDSVMMVPSASFYEFEPEGDNTRRLLDTLGFNRNLVKSYKAADNTSISFVDDGRELYVDVQNSAIAFNGQGRGIHISEYLKYKPQSENYSFGDILLCSRRLINSLDRLLTGGQAYPAIVSIYAEDDVLTVDFKYFYNGILITDAPSDLSISFKNNYIVSMNINAVFCDSGNNTNPVVPQKLALNTPDDESNIIGMYYNAMYVAKNDSTDVDFVWITRKKGEEN